ncbi:MAG: beta-N-acetylhexosaminidase [Alistipes sp.]|nr:beta-N-acetylhexosaminidase [Alistipes sp.]
MKKKMLSALAAILGIVGATTAQIAIFPQPEYIDMSQGEYVVTEKTNIVAEEGMEAPARRFAEDMSPLLAGGKRQMKVARHGKGIRLREDKCIGAEGYELTVTPDGITVIGGSEAGVYYGLQTLRQMIVAGSGTVPCCYIADAPTFAYRGAHLDVCRHFFTVDQVKRYIDIIAAHKVNRFHWHLTDDQGWRIEIKRYPELTRTGAVRKCTLIGRPSQGKGYDDTPHGGFYTQEEIRDVVAYAAERYITVIPEIEMPGHALAALAAYPWLGCKGEGYEVWPDWGITPEVMCGGRESTYEFLENVLAEVLELFPSEYIHIGGDECPKDHWKECAECQAAIERLGLDNEEQLQGYLVNRIEKWLVAHGRKMIGWDEILDCGITQTANIMSWRGPEGGIKAAKRGNDAIMTPSGYCYFDSYQTRDREGEPLAIGRWVPVEKVYGFDPFDKLDDEQRSHILGVQCNMWTEYIADFDHLQTMLLPRLAALSDVQWATDRRDASTLRERMEVMRRFYDACGYRYATFYYDGRQ